MDSVTGNFVKGGQSLADKTADRVQSGIRDAQHAAKDAGTALSAKVDDLRGDAGPALKKATHRAQYLGKQGMDSLSEAAQRAREIASNASDSIVSYTKENPLKALMFAAAAGALLLSVVKLGKASRD
jgi:ElaB/YqjD/DUF883 family membrane-anchored ribosome-binding protein